jgi:hypothetical protein
MVRLSLTFGELGEIYGRVVCTRGSSLISPVMFTLPYSMTGTSQSATGYACIYGSLLHSGPCNPSIHIRKRSSFKLERTRLQVTVRIARTKVFIRVADAGLPRIWAYFIDHMVIDLTTIAMYILFPDSCS